MFYVFYSNAVYYKSIILRYICQSELFIFFVVEQRRQPDLKGQPTAVVQYNPWKGGGLIAVGYEARKFGVKR